MLTRYLLLFTALLIVCPATAQDKTWNGRKVERYSNGKKKSIKRYRYGLPNGKYRKWNEEGKLVEKKMYVDGKLNGWAYSWSHSGVLLEKCHYQNDKKNGKCYNYHYSGERDLEKTFLNDSVTTYTLFPKNEVARQWISFDLEKAEIGETEKALLDAFLEKAKAQADYPIRIPTLLRL